MFLDDHYRTRSLRLEMGSIPASEYPFFNPRELAGAGPYAVGLGFYEDYVQMNIEYDASLSACEMLVGLGLGPGITWQKELWGWHAVNGPVSSVIAVDRNTGPNFMLLHRADAHSGADTVLFKKAKRAGVMTGMYALNTSTFWSFCGGTKVTFKWLSDSPANGGGSGIWGEATPVPARSTFVDGGARSFASGAQSRLIKGAGDFVFFSFGGAKFHIPNPMLFNQMGYDWNAIAAVAESDVEALDDIPFDGTVFFESNPPGPNLVDIYFIVGGAKLHVTAAAARELLLAQAEEGLIQVGRVWNGALSSVPTTPRDNTLLRERSADPVYVMRAGKKCHVASPARFDQLCFDWENVRVVPDGSLAGLPDGAEL